jgi:hypothetical protein
MVIRYNAPCNCRRSSWLCSTRRLEGADHKLPKEQENGTVRGGVCDMLGCDRKTVATTICLSIQYL